MSDTTMSTGTIPHASPRVPAASVFLVFLRLGLTSFGGPIAHLGYFHDAFVVRRKWLEEAAYADLVALCQFLPGPASTQVAIGIGLIKSGVLGSLAAWLGFNLPSAALMILFGLGAGAFHAWLPPGIFHGLMIAAVAVVAQAVWTMAQRLCPDSTRRAMAVLAALAALAVAGPWAQIGIIACGGVLGAILLRGMTGAPAHVGATVIPKSIAALLLALFFLLLVALPWLDGAYPSQPLHDVSAFYQTGALVFGGGHVVLPLLQARVVAPGWVSNAAFLSGYGAAQAIPGPLFTFAAYLGTVMRPAPNGVVGGLLCLMAISLPSFFLVLGALPFWNDLRRFSLTQRALAGVNAAVVGLLLAALYNPVWVAAIQAPLDFGLAVAAFALLTLWKMPPWIVVLLSAVGGWGLQFGM